MEKLCIELCWSKRAKENFVGTRIEARRRRRRRKDSRNDSNRLSALCIRKLLFIFFYVATMPAFVRAHKRKIAGDFQFPNKSSNWFRVPSMRHPANWSREPRNRDIEFTREVKRCPREKLVRLIARTASKWKRSRGVESGVTHVWRRWPISRKGATCAFHAHVQLGEMRDENTTYYRLRVTWNCSCLVIDRIA